MNMRHLTCIVILFLPRVCAQYGGNELSVDEPVSDFGDMLQVPSSGNISVSSNQTTGGSEIPSPHELSVDEQPLSESGTMPEHPASGNLSASSNQTTGGSDSPSLHELSVDEPTTSGNLSASTNQTAGDSSMSSGPNVELAVEEPLSEFATLLENHASGNLSASSNQTTEGSDFPSLHELSVDGPMASGNLSASTNQTTGGSSMSLGPNVELAVEEPLSEFATLLENHASGNLSATSNETEGGTLAVVEVIQPILILNSTGGDQAVGSNASATIGEVVKVIEPVLILNGSDADLSSNNNGTKFENIILNSTGVEQPLMANASWSIDEPSHSNAVDGEKPSVQQNGTGVEPVQGDNSTSVKLPPMLLNSSMEEEPLPQNFIETESSGNNTNVLDTVDIHALVQKTDAAIPIVDNLLVHSKLLTQLANLTVEKHGEKWTFMDICHRLPPPRAVVRSEGVFAEIIANIFDAISPCVVMSPLDCFWDGSKALGPFPPHNPGPAAKALFPSLQSLDEDQGISWKNINLVILGGDFENMGSLFANVSNKVIGTFENAAGDSYMDRPCLDPIDPECPVSAPNKFEICSAVDQFAAWKEKLGTPLTIDLEKKTAQTVRQKLLSQCIAETPDSIRCEQYSEEVRTFIQETSSSGGTIEFLNGTGSLPQVPEETITKLTNEGCNGVFSKIMNWPKEVLVDSEKNAEGKAVINRLRTVIPLNNAARLFDRYKDHHPAKPALDVSKWTVASAQEVLDAWKSEASKILSGGATLEAETSDGSEQFPADAIEKLGPALQKVQSFYDSLKKLEDEENL